MATAITVAQALFFEQNPSQIPPGSVFFISDTATNVEALTAVQLAQLPAERIDVSDLNGAGPLILEDGYSYAVHGPVSSGDTITFADIGSTLSFDDAAAMAGTIFGFAPSDTIDLTDVAFDRNNGSVHLAANNVLDVTENGHTYALHLNPSQNFSGEFFHLAADAAGTGTNIIESTAPCYCRGTLIRTARGERAVEELKIGDQIMTKSGVARPVKWIGRRGYAGHLLRGRKDLLPVCIKAGALAPDLPQRDLWISPHHAMYFDSTYFDGNDCTNACLGGVLIEAKDLVNGASIVQADDVEETEYFHVELDTHDVIIAEAALSESFIDDDSRDVFGNADEFHTLYPQARYPQTLASAAQYCAPRLEQGYDVAAVCHRIAMRAGRMSSADTVGPLHGFVDSIGPRSIEGWAQHANAREVPVCLDVYAGGRLLGQTLANVFSAGLVAAGLGSGHHGFRFALPEGFVPAGEPIEVRRSSDGALLPGASDHRAAA
jgi:hypothetical protein